MVLAPGLLTLSVSGRWRKGTSNMSAMCLRSGWLETIMGISHFSSPVVSEWVGVRVSKGQGQVRSSGAAGHHAAHPQGRMEGMCLDPLCLPGPPWPADKPLTQFIKRPPRMHSPFRRLDLIYDLQHSPAPVPLPIRSPCLTHRSCGG